MSDYDIYIGIDPGLKGGITVISARKTVIHRIPVRTVESSNRKKKSVYDLDGLVEIFKPYSKRSVIIGLERVSPRPGEGTVSSFTFGKGVGQLEGLCAAFGFTVEEISPVTWKKEFPELKSEAFNQLKEQVKEKQKQSKEIKDKAKKNLNSKEIKKLKEAVKREAKDQSRVLSGKLYPKLKDEFKLVRDDGKADSCLIATYLVRKYGSKQKNTNKKSSRKKRTTKKA
jgi:hypothetical protein